MWARTGGMKRPRLPCFSTAACQNVCLFGILALPVALTPPSVMVQIEPVRIAADHCDRDSDLAAIEVRRIRRNAGRVVGIAAGARLRR